MTRRAQDDEERAALDLMIEKLGLLVAGEPKRGKPPAPDFELHLSDGRVLAIEHTDVRDENLAPVSATVKRWKQATKEHLAKLGASVWVIATFDEGAAAMMENRENRKRKALRREAELIAKLAAEDAPSVPKGGFTQHDLPDLEARGIEFAFQVQVLRYNGRLATWSTRGRGQRRHLIQEAITAKADKLPAYRAAAPAGAEVWLMAVAGSGGHGSAVDAFEAEGTFVSPFDTTVFVEMYEGKCVVLATHF
jgi:hypothetical protein